MMEIYENLKSDYQFQFSEWVTRTEESEIRRLLRYSPKYYFAGGKPGVIPIETFHKIIRELLEEESRLLVSHNPNSLNRYNYGPTEGSQELRKVLSNRLIRRDGLKNINESDLVITNGSQQALYGLCDTLLTPGDIILTTRPSYLGFIQCAEKLGGRIVTLPSDKDGMITDSIPSAINACIKKFRKKPKLLYSIPYSDNPQGTTLSSSRKFDILNYSYDYDYFIIEDMAYKEIQFHSDRFSPIKKHDNLNEKIAYLSTSTKEAASFRIGYSVMPSSLRKELIKAKGIYDLCSSEWVQAILTRYYSKHIDKVLPQIRKEYKRRCDTMIKSITENLQGHFSTPTGGFFIWFASQDSDFNSTSFLKQALQHDISYVPGKAFFPTNGFNYNDTTQINPCFPQLNAMRLGYSLLEPQEIIAGIEKLGNLLSNNFQKKR